MTIVYILAAILIFGVLIAVHELGHFLAAKLCGVRVNEFSIGMGPLIWHKETEETQYSLRLLPIGGFCAMEGETYQGYGVYIARDQIEEANLWTILKTSWLNTIDFVRIVRLSLQMLVTGQAGMDDLSGPVGIVSTITQVGTASETIAAAVENILYFGAMLAVNLAVMNMLPIPALDGGKIFFLIIDEIAMKLFRKKIPEKYEMAVNTVGFVALMGFMLVVTFNDVFKLFG